MVVYYRTRKLVLPSALTKEEAKEAKERIEKGFEVEVEQPSTTQTEKPLGDETEEEQSEAPPTVVVSEETAAAARDAEFNALFSSDSDDEDIGQPRVLRRTKKKAAKGVEKDTTAADIESDAKSNEGANVAKENGVTETEMDDSAQPKTDSAQNSTSGEASTAAHTQPANPTKQPLLKANQALTRWISTH